MFGKLSRRHFAKLAGLSALGIATTTADVAAQAASERPGPASFPKDFVWGTATSAYQIEGAVNEDGRGRSIWDTFSHTPGKIEDHSTGDRANEHYVRYKEDIGLIREVGAKAYRFSIAWPRVFPEGAGKHRRRLALQRNVEGVRRLCRPCRGADHRPRQVDLHDQRSRQVREFRL